MTIINMGNAKVDWNAREVIRDIGAAADKSSKKTANRIAADARRLCPVGSFEYAARSGQSAWKQRRPGTLRDSIKVRKSRYKGMGYTVSAGGFYAYYVLWVELGAPERSDQKWRESGHKYPVPRQPFLRPAGKKNKTKVFSDFSSVLDEMGIKENW